MARKKKQPTQPANHVLLSDETIQEMLSNMPEEMKIQFFKALGKDLESGGVGLSNLPPLPPAPKRKPKAQKSTDGRIYCCVECGSALKWTHLSKEEWMIILSGFINNHSMTVISMDAGVSPSTVCECHKKVCNALMQMYGYSDKFNHIWVGFL